MRRYLIIFLLLLLVSSTKAQIYYLSSKNVNNGIILGVEIFNPKTNNSLNISGFNYEWILPDISLDKRYSRNRVIFIPLDKLYPSLLVNLKISGVTLGKSTIYSFKDKIKIKEPKVVIVKKSSNILLPLIYTVKNNETLYALVHNSFNDNLIYRWNFNEAFISSDKEIKVNNLFPKNGIIKVVVFDPLTNKSISDERLIQIE